MACGYGQFTIQINYDPTKLITNDVWATPACLASITAFSDGFCGSGATATCSSMPTTDANGCAWIDGAYVCPSDFSSTAPSGFSPLCQQITLAGCSGSMWVRCPVTRMRKAIANVRSMTEPAERLCFGAKRRLRLYREQLRRWCLGCKWHLLCHRGDLGLRQQRAGPFRDKNQHVELCRSDPLHGQ